MFVFTVAGRPGSGRPSVESPAICPALEPERTVDGAIATKTNIEARDCTAEGAKIQEKAWKVPFLTAPVTRAAVVSAGSVGWGFMKVCRQRLRKRRASVSTNGGQYREKLHLRSNKRAEQ